MSNIFPIDFEEKNVIAQNDYILFSDSQDCNKLKKAQYCNLKGETGNAATVCVGSVSTLAPGCSATVTNTGTQYAAVFDFGIPQGATGCTGATGARICSAKFCGDDMVFTETNGCKVTIVGAKTTLTGPQGCQGPEGCQGPQGCEGPQGCTGPQGPSGTITVGTTTTLDAGCSATVTNSGTCEAAVFNFGIPKGDKGDTGPTGCTGPAGNGIACVTSTKAGKVTTVDITCTNGCSYCFTVSDGEDGQGSGDMLKCVYDPNNVNADAFDYCNFTNTPTIPTDNCQLSNGCCYAKTCDIPTDNCQLGNSCGYATTSQLSCKQDTLTVGANIDITCNKISSTNNYIITEAITCTTYTGTLGVSPYNTSYCYTNICIDPSSGVVWREGSVYTFDIDTKMIATSACRNVRVKIGDGTYIPVMNTSSILAGNTYFTKANTRQYMYSTKYQSCGALHLFSDSNTTYSAMSNSEATTGTCTSSRTIAACTLKCAIDARGYTTCTGTLSTCADVISALGYTPYSSANPSGYTTCTGTLTSGDLTVVSGDTGCTYTIKVSNSDPGAGTPSTTITFVTA